MTRLAIFFLWLLHFLPSTALISLGNGLGRLLYLVAIPRRRITLTNLGLCFPELSEAERIALAKRHFALFGRTFIERTVLWWGSAERIRAMARVEGLEHVRTQGTRPIILFGIHFVGMDLGWTRLSLELDMSAMYSLQKNKVFNDLMVARRNRFGDCVMISRQEGIKAAITAMCSGKPLMYLPDMDFGPQHSIFVPFFGVNTATITGLSKLAASSGAAVVPTITRLEADGWVVRILPAWQDFPTDDLVADTRRMNAFIEQQAGELPEQYWWTHKRFKTRPPGEKSFY
jgi:KDO2-lipid IV(A) lauroyltransferase